jgi:GNAT superfamily N-acetyltransferase
MPAHPGVLRVAGLIAIRRGADEDADGYIALIGACWAEYPGCVMDLDGEVPELRALASYVGRRRGALWSAEADCRIVGMLATYPEEDGVWTISRMYVDRSCRGSGLADRLLDAAESHAVAAGARRLALWSDTRFERAHRFYERRGYVRTGPLRALNDLSHSIEFRYAKPVAGIETLSAAGAASAARPLAELLCACVEAGASVSFLAPLPSRVALDYWRRVARQAAGGARIVIAGWAEARLMGSVVVDLEMPQNQPHRAEIKKLLVHPLARRRGLARALMGAAENEAREAGRTLLTLDTRAGDPAETLYRALGWQEAGRIPGYALAPDGTPGETAFFYKRLMASPSQAVFRARDLACPVAAALPHDRPDGDVPRVADADRKQQPDGGHEDEGGAIHV